jgi:hypothetical protein
MLRLFVLLLLALAGCARSPLSSDTRANLDKVGASSATS